jgi:dipeptidyl aminopeptidase/acylaminoacyl peptidase
VHFLFLALGNPDSSGIYAGSTASNEIRRLFDANEPAVFMPPDHLLYIRQGTLLARRFDPQKLELTGEPTPIAQQVASVSAVAGVIAYRNAPAGASRPLQLSWFDRSGKIMEDLPPGFVLGPELSPDGGRLAFFRGDGGANFNIWVLDLATGRPNRVTAETGVKGFPEWSPDGSRVAFTTNSGRELHVKLASGVGTEETLFKSPNVLSPSDWSADGRHILIQSGLVFQRDILALPMSSEGKPAGQPIPIATSARFDERDAKFSPDGHWIAYQSNETGRFEIYLVPFPSLDTKLTVTSAGGREVRWRHDGKELFYLSLDGKMMSVPVTPSANPKTLNIGVASALFSTNHLAMEPSPDINGQSYVVSPDGKRFLLYSTMEESFNSPITLILHWKPPAK